MKMLLRVHFYIVIFLTLTSLAQAQTTRYVLASATGSANGTNWTNAYTTMAQLIPNITRGDTIYIGTGTYTCGSGGCDFNTADSGTSVITIKGAIASDHGAAGDFQASFGVDVTPATFATSLINAFDSLIRFDSDYWVFDGNTRTGYETGHGFIVNNQYPNMVALAISIASTSFQNHDITIRNVHILGGGLDNNTAETTTAVSFTCSGGNTVNAVVNSNGTNWHGALVNQWILVSGVTGGSGFNIAGNGVQISAVTDGLHFSYPSTCSGSGTGGTVAGPARAGEAPIYYASLSTQQPSVLIDKVYVSNSSNDCMDFTAGLSTAGAGTGFTIQYSEINGCSSTPGSHGQGIGSQGYGSAGLVVRYNVLKDIEGTAALQLEGNNPPAIDSNISVYGNVWVVANGNPNNRVGVGNGFILCGANVNCSTIKIYNNDFINLSAYSSSNNFVFFYTDNGAGGSCDNVQIYNNIFYNSSPVNDAETPACTNFTRDYNSWLNTTAPSVTFGPHELQDNSPPNPFVNWPNGNYHLASNNNDWGLTNPGITLSAPYNTDPDGVVRGTPDWSRGTYQFVSAGQAQTITFAGISNRVLGSPPFNVSATASSGLTVSFSSKTPSTCTLVDHANGTATITLVAVGTCTIAANQAGNANWLAAPEVDQSFSIFALVTFLKKSPNSNHPAGTTFPILMQLVDVNSKPISNTSVTFLVTRGAGSITGGAAMTDVNGMISATVVLDANPGLNTFTMTTGTAVYVLNQAGF